MSTIHIIGVGSPLHCDDLAWRVAERVQQSRALEHVNPEDVCVSICDRPGPVILALMRDTELTILVDAVISGAAPGTVHRLGLEQIMHGPGGLSSHGFGLAASLELGRALGDLPPKVVLFGIEAPQHCCGDEQQCALQRGIDDCVDQVVNEISAMTGENP